jgi:FxLD family lantipeptide
MQTAETVVTRTPQDVADDAFALDVVVVTDVRPGGVAAPCNTDDGCAPTCASSCVSAV